MPIVVNAVSTKEFLSGQFIHSILNMIEEDEFPEDFIN